VYIGDEDHPGDMLYYSCMCMPTCPTQDDDFFVWDIPTLVTDRSHFRDDTLTMCVKVPIRYNYTVNKRVTRAHAPLNPELAFFVAVAGFCACFVLFPIRHCGCSLSRALSRSLSLSLARALSLSMCLWLAPSYPCLRLRFSLSRA